jgi:ABC-type polysaccharide/polyol phosphate export permease
MDAARSVICSSRSTELFSLKALIELFRSVVGNRSLIWQLAIHQFKSEYAATALGAIWAILQPIALLCVFWLVFSQGFRVRSADPQTPYFIVLFCGLVPWMMFNNVVVGGAGIIIQHQYLLRKLAFPLEILPVVHLVSSGLIHAVLLLVLFIILLVYGIVPGVKCLLLIYYFCAMACFVLGLSLVLSAVNVFHRDVGQVVGVVANMWFWLTPVVWQPATFPPNLVAYLKLNPAFYIVEGYRDALLPAAEGVHIDLTMALYFWGIALFLLMVGAVVFRRLKPHFGDVI